MSDTKILKLDSMSLQNLLDEDSELIPLMTAEDEEEIVVIWWQWRTTLQPWFGYAGHKQPEEDLEPSCFRARVC